MLCYKDISLYTFFVVISIILLFSLTTNIFNNDKEGFTTNSATNRENISDTIKNDANKLSDNLLISKYRSTYEETIIHLENLTGLTLLSETINNAELISSNPISKESLTAISNINNLKQFKETLNDVMNILDKAK